MKLRMGSCGGSVKCSLRFVDTARDFEIASADCDEDGGGEGDCSSGGSGGEVVVVGVKLDTRSKELLTWALVKVAKPGDQVIAIHVIDPNNEDGAATLSAVKNFDISLASAYDGLCKLKQIDFKFNVSRGTPVHKVLAQEATCWRAMCLVVGASVTQSAMKSAVSVARYCARNVEGDITVLSVDNGKIMFKREATIGVCGLQGLHGTESRSNKKKTLSLSSSSLQMSEEYSSQLSSVSMQDVNNTKAVVPVNSRGVPEKKSGWAFLRKLLLHKGKSSSQPSIKKPLVRQWISRLPSRRSISTICPDQEQAVSNKVDHQSCDLDMDYCSVESPVAVTSSSLHLSDCQIGMLPKEVEDLLVKYASKCRLFGYQELLSATSNFKDENVIGKGGSSNVYRSILQNGEELAVKILNPSGDVSKQFVSEIKILTTLDHKNIISLLGFCFEENRQLLVYDILSRGSLEDNLHGSRRSGDLFGWKERYKVALGVAEALEHLHNTNPIPIIHRDVKSSNILLSDDFEPKLSDFGLAMLGSGSSYHIDNADVAGTFGYLAPEYVMHGKVIDKIDVYAYGVVLLELLSGRKPIENENENEHAKGCWGNLVTWAEANLKGGKFANLLDPTLVDSHDHDHLEQMVLAARLCIRRAPYLRPQMSLVVKLLQGDLESIKWAREQTNISDELDAVEAEQSATNIQSFINLALLNLEDDTVSSSSGEQTVSVEDYLRGRFSRSSSFNLS